jgi:hypothetical protein
MPNRANVTSLDALKAFRANLIIYVTKARPTLEEVGADVLRTRLWLENDQRSYWENQIRRRTRVLEEAQAALFSSKLSNLREVTVAEQTAVLMARRSLAEAEDKLKIIKHWTRDFDNRTQPMTRQLEKLHTVLSNDMSQALAYLSQAIDALEAYAQVMPPSSSGAVTDQGGQAKSGGKEQSQEISSVAESEAGGNE